MNQSVPKPHHRFQVRHLLSILLNLTVCAVVLYVMISPRFDWGVERKNGQYTGFLTYNAKTTTELTASSEALAVSNKSPDEYRLLPVQDEGPTEEPMSPTLASTGSESSFGNGFFYHAREEQVAQIAARHRIAVDALLQANPRLSRYSEVTGSVWIPRR